MEVKKLNEFAPRVFQIARQICDKALAANPGSLDFRSAIDELDDCNQILMSQFDPDTVEDIMNETSSDALLNLLKEAKPHV